MSTRPITDTFTPELRERLTEMERELHVLAATPMSRDQAIYIRQKFALPLGVLSKNHGLDLKTRKASQYR